MKQFVIEIEYDRHLIQASDEAVDNLEALYREFRDWLGDRENDHGYWLAMDGSPADPNGRDCLCYDANAFLKWLNENHNAQAEIIATEPAGLHHTKEFFEWAKNKGYVSEETIAAQIAENAVRFGIDAEKLGTVTLWYDDSLYPAFVKETDSLPDILRLVEKTGVKRVYF
jgi:hypothetical protein